MLVLHEYYFTISSLSHGTASNSPRNCFVKKATKNNCVYTFAHLVDNDTWYYNRSYLSIIVVVGSRLVRVRGHFSCPHKNEFSLQNLGRTRNFCPLQCIQILAVIKLNQRNRPLEGDQAQTLMFRSLLSVSGVIAFLQCPPPVVAGPGWVRPWNVLCIRRSNSTAYRSGAYNRG